MILIVWNSQGAKWDDFWTYYIAPVTAASPDDVTGLLVESGWAPWVMPGVVLQNEMIIFPTDKSQVLAPPPVLARSAFCQGVEAGQRQRRAFWVPWARQVEDTTNTRCSVGGVIIRQRLAYGIERFVSDHVIRPIARLSYGIGPSLQITILLVHLTSGNPVKAQAEMNRIIELGLQATPHGTAVMIVGDFNINLLTAGGGLILPPSWRVVRTGVPTQQSGGELDFAVLYDPGGHYAGVRATIVDQYKTGNNQSDHSVLRYDIPVI